MDSPSFCQSRKFSFPPAHTYPQGENYQNSYGYSVGHGKDYEVFFFPPRGKHNEFCDHFQHATVMTGK
ncbi:hypothetical protein POVWA1_032820 [Plasmodium ovale wallikeri]|uniref:Uncharacterized protein n=1 Tax=Plasmodium ovale wallikeri TaxID=864142 RepID=A0A1A8YYJ3_PLAOA|nr:hypothetical protein POVWA1_032820 [Plasmodium ovale wallikeri]